MHKNEQQINMYNITPYKIEFKCQQKSTKLRQFRENI